MTSCSDPGKYVPNLEVWRNRYCSLFLTAARVVWHHSGGFPCQHVHDRRSVLPLSSTTFALAFGHFAVMSLDGFYRLGKAHFVIYQVKTYMFGPLLPTT